jgi:hypothetical protein
LQGQPVFAAVFVEATLQGCLAIQRADKFDFNDATRLPAALATLESGRVLDVRVNARWQRVPSFACEHDCWSCQFDRAAVEWENLLDRLQIHTEFACVRSLTGVVSKLWFLP